MKELRYINKYFIKYRGRLALGLIITIVAKIFSLFIPIFIGNQQALICVVTEHPDGSFSNQKRLV